MPLQPSQLLLPRGGGGVRLLVKVSTGVNVAVMPLALFSEGVIAVQVLEVGVVYSTFPSVSST